jgi:hypothetical protein
LKLETASGIYVRGFFARRFKEQEIKKVMACRSVAMP